MRFNTKIFKFPDTAGSTVETKSIHLVKEDLLTPLNVTTISWGEEA